MFLHLHTRDTPVLGHDPRHILGEQERGEIVRYIDPAGRRSSRPSDVQRSSGARLDQLLGGLTETIPLGKFDRRDDFELRRHCMLIGSKER